MTSTWLGHTLRRALTLVSAAMLTYLLMDLLPGDAATIIALAADPNAVAQLRHSLGLDEPALTRMWDWFTGLVLHGDGGLIYRTRTSVWDAAAPALRNSAMLLAIAFPLQLVVGIGAGIVAGLRPLSKRDRTLSAGAQLTLATPDFALTIVLLVLFAGVLHIAPAVSLIPPGATPWQRPEILLVPSLAIALIGGAWLQRTVRSAVATAALQPHVHAAALAGWHPVTVFFRHTLPTAAPPIAQACAATVPFALMGTVVVENVVGFPGIGSMLSTLVTARETEAVATITSLFALVTTVAFAIADAITEFVGRRVP